MNPNDPNEINRLIGRFTDLHEQWESNSQNFDWTLLEALAREGASAYREGSGPAFHSLALDGMQHSEFHERFLAYSIGAGFDPFKLSDDGSGKAEFPVLDHATLAKQARSNPCSQRMHQSLKKIAQEKFGPLVQQARDDQAVRSQLYKVFQACAESISSDLLEQIEPELAQSHSENESEHAAFPKEPYLSAPESIIDSARPHG